MLLSKEAIPISATIIAATDAEAPRSRAVSGTIGKMAPSPMPKSTDGPKAGRAIYHIENGELEAAEAVTRYGRGKWHVKELR